MSETKLDYQKTLNLPQTDFSMRAGLTTKEPSLLEQWAKEDLYGQLQKKFKGKKSFVLHDGPPYANGNIHMGHALNKILKDMIVKSRSMQDLDCYYLPGWDCHGLPIEHQLLKELKMRKSDVDCVDFRKKAHDYAMKFVNVQREQFERLGIFGKWNDPYLTLSPEYEYWILRSLATLNENGYVYRGLKPVNWCFSCETALAEAEVEYEDHQTESIYVKFKVNNPETIKAGKNLSLLVWTTTPWTLMANVAVAVHANFQYALVDINNEQLIIEESLVKPVMAKLGEGVEYKIIARLEGKKLTALKYEHPFGLKENCPVVDADYVTKEDGTGLVHTAPGHGQEDFETGIKHKLEVIMPVDDRGIYLKEAGDFAGQHVFKANSLIIERLKQKGKLFASQALAHTYPHCWRCKNPIIFRATKQWFLKIDHKDLRKRLIDQIKNKVQWIPPSGEERIMGMIAGRPDWCLSRQRYWGVPIPAISCQKCQEPKLYGKVVNHFADIVKKEGSTAWFERGIDDLLPKGFSCPDCGGQVFTKTFDILDVWFDSGVSHQAVVKAILGKELPIDLYLEGSDQHRGWFQSSLIPAVALEGKAPFRSVLTHGFVVDGAGRKMSKSLGNVISPLDIMKNNGADILRLWVASSSYNEDIRVSPEILERLVDAYRKIRNTFRYLLGNLFDFDPDRHMLDYADLKPIDQWALNNLHALLTSVRRHYDEYDFAKAYQSIYAFCNVDLSSFYLDILKDRLYTSATNSPERRSAQTVLYHMTDSLVRVVAPILTFTTEEIFAAMPKSASAKNARSVHLLNWREIPAEWANQKLFDRFKFLVDLRPHVLKALEDKRRSGEIGSSLEAKVVFTSSSQRDLASLNENKTILPEVFIVSQVEIIAAASIDQGLNEEFAKTKLTIERSAGSKCSRCWNFKTDVGQDKEHPGLCARCTTIVKEFKE